MTNNRHNLSTPAVGFFLIIIMLGKYANTGSIMYRISMGVAIPAIFVLIGYNLRFPNNLMTFVKQTGMELLTLIVPSYASYFFLQLYTYANKNWGNMAYWDVYMNYTRDTFYYSAARNYGDIPSLGVVWILVSAFFIKLIINAIWIIAGAISRHCDSKLTIERQGILTYIICFIVGLIGLTLLSKYIILPLNLSADFLLILLALVGMLWKAYANKISNKLGYILLAVMTAVGIGSIINDRVMDIGALRFPGHIISVVLSLCCIFPICYLIQAISKISVIRNILSIHSKNGIILLVVYELNAVYSIIWATDNVVISTVILMLVSDAICLVIVQGRNIICKKMEQDNTALHKHKPTITIIYYCTVIMLYLTSMMTYSTITNIISGKTQNELIMLATSVLLMLFPVALPYYPSKKIKLFIITLFAVALCQTIIRQGQNTIFTLVVLTGTSILANTHVIARIIWIVESASLFVLYILSMNGYIPYYVVSTGAGGLTGHSFGLIGKNELAAFLLAISITYCLARKCQNRLLLIIDVLVIGLNAFVNYRYVGGRADFALTMLLLLGTIVYRTLGVEPLKIKAFDAVAKYIHYIISVPIYVFTMVIYLIFAWNFDGVTIPFGNIISKFTDVTTYSNRLWLSKTALLVYRPKIWGQYIFENDSATSGEGAGYFWIDCSYVRMLLMYGILATCIVIILLTVFQIEKVKRRQYYKSFLGIIIALMGIMGHRIPIILFNPILPILFANECSTSITVNEKSG